KAAVELSDQPGVEVVADDLCVRQPPAGGRGLGSEHPRVRASLAAALQVRLKRLRRTPEMRVVATIGAVVLGAALTLAQGRGGQDGGGTTILEQAPKE